MGKMIHFLQSNVSLWLFVLILVVQSFATQNPIKGTMESFSEQDPEVRLQTYLQDQQVIGRYWEEGAWPEYGLSGYADIDMLHESYGPIMNDEQIRFLIDLPVDSSQIRMNVIRGRILSYYPKIEMVNLYINGLLDNGNGMEDYTAIVFCCRNGRVSEVIDRIVERGCYDILIEQLRNGGQLDDHSTKILLSTVQLGEISLEKMMKIGYVFESIGRNDVIVSMSLDMFSGLKLHQSEVTMSDARALYYASSTLSRNEIRVPEDGLYSLLPFLDSEYRYARVTAFDVLLMEYAHGSNVAEILLLDASLNNQDEVIRGMASEVLRGK